MNAALQTLLSRQSVGAKHLVDPGPDDDALRTMCEAALRAPVTVAVLACIDLGHTLVPAHEQWACVGGALTNLLNAAHALGFGGKMLSGAKVRYPAVQRAFCEPGETLVGWIALGTPAASPAHKPTKPRASGVLREWVAPRER